MGPIENMAKVFSSGFVDEDTRKTRINICEDCEDYLPIWIGGESRWSPRTTCKHCGCNMPFKTKFNAAECPIGKW